MYEKIVADSLEFFKQFPVVIPDGDQMIFGPGGEYRLPNSWHFMNDNHHFPMGTTYLEYGIEGVIAKALESRKNLLSLDMQAENLQSIALVYRGVAELFDRYLKEIETRLEKAEGKEKKHLEILKENMFVLRYKRAETFTQGLELYYLFWRFRGHGDIGRIDYHLYPLYEEELKRGASEEDLLSVIVEFYQKLNTVCSGDTLVNISLGGYDTNGKDTSSRLSYLFLKANTIVKKTEPHINVRKTKNMREDVFDMAVEVQSLGQGQATFYFDDVVIPALINRGLPKEIACSYTNDGCTEITYDGHAGIEFRHIDIVATLECALHRGKRIVRDYFVPIRYFHKDNIPNLYTPDIRYGYDSGDMLACKTFEEFYAIFLKQFRYQVLEKADGLKRMHDDLMVSGLNSVFLAGTFEKSLNTGIDLMRGGFDADCYQIFSGSIPTVADELLAIKKAVFEDKICTLQTLLDATAVNYAGYEDLRQKLLSYPKFGNDNDEVDLLGADIVKHFCDVIEEYTKSHNFVIHPDLLGWKFLEEAYGTGAGFDGRKYAEQIAEHYCSTPGKSKNGPTAIINSISKAPLHRCSGTVATHISLPLRLGPDHKTTLAILKALDVSAEEKGLIQLNIAMYDADKLREAQAHPEGNEDVIVRVWGYSAKFVDLCKEMQDHIISRITTLGY